MTKWLLQIPVVVRLPDGYVVSGDTGVFVTIPAETAQGALKTLSEVLDGLIAEKVTRAIQDTALGSVLNERSKAG